MKNRERGFSAVEIIIGVVVLGVIVAIIYSFVHASSDKQAVATSPSAGASPTVSPSSISAADETLAASDHVKSFYKAYLAVANTNKPDNSSWVKQGFWTQSAADQADATPGIDVPTCSQNPPSFESYGYAAPVITGSSGTLIISDNTTYTAGKGPVFNVSLVKDNGVWKITAFKCSTPS